jgi:hypothetical protein
MAVLIEAIAPTILAGDKFRQWRDEGKADFAADVAAQPAGCLRRFHIESVTERGIPEVSNMTTAQIRCTFRISVAYPNNSRSGSRGARDRADMIDRDWNKLNFVVGLYGRANFSGTNDRDVRRQLLVHAGRDGVMSVIRPTEYPIDARSHRWLCNSQPRLGTRC